jgi:hypothetical protein
MTRTYRKYIAIVGESRYFIEEERPEVGWYLHVYKNGSAVADHRQDSFVAVVAQAIEKYGVRSDAWEEVQTDPIWAL